MHLRTIWKWTKTAIWYVVISFREKKDSISFRSLWSRAKLQFWSIFKLLICTLFIQIRSKTLASRDQNKFVCSWLQTLFPAQKYTPAYQGRDKRTVWLGYHEIYHIPEGKTGNITFSLFLSVLMIIRSTSWTLLSGLYMSDAFKPDKIIKSAFLNRFTSAFAQCVLKFV